MHSRSLFKDSEELFGKDIHSSLLNQYFTNLFKHRTLLFFCKVTYIAKFSVLPAKADLMFTLTRLCEYGCVYTCILPEEI